MSVEGEVTRLSAWALALLAAGGYGVLADGPPTSDAHTRRGMPRSISEALAAAQDAITVKRVFAEPYEKDGLTVITAAAVAGGAGGGSGTDSDGEQGEGSGFGANARPVGAYVLRDGQLHWRPAIDLNRIVTMVGLVAIVYLLRRPRRK